MKPYVSAVTEEARKHLGYRAGPGRIQPFGPRGLPWNGAFLDFVLTQCGLTTGTVHASVPGAHAYYAGHGKMRTRARVGDIVFLADGQLGLVTEVGMGGTFRSVEAETASPLPKGETGAVGIYEHNRFPADVIGFARPNYRIVRAPKVNAHGAVLRVAEVTSGNPLAVMMVRSAMGLALSGRWDAEVTSAFKACQRRFGTVGLEPDGLPDFETLSRLGLETGLFSVRI